MPRSVTTARQICLRSVGSLIQIIPALEAGAGQFERGLARSPRCSLRNSEVSAPGALAVHVLGSEPRTSVFQIKLKPKGDHKLLKRHRKGSQLLSRGCLRVLLGWARLSQTRTAANTSGTLEPGEVCLHVATPGSGLAVYPLSEFPTGRILTDSRSATLCGGLFLKSACITEFVLTYMPSRQPLAQAEPRSPGTRKGKLAR